MGTDFTDGIIAANGFLISKTDVPTRIGSRIETLDEMESIPNPAVGMLVYVRSTGEYYSVKTLKSKDIGGITVENAVVDAYEPLVKNEITWVDVE